jgi:hypothetical protein
MVQGILLSPAIIASITRLADETVCPTDTVHPRAA